MTIKHSNKDEFVETVYVVPLVDGYVKPGSTVISELDGVLVTHILKGKNITYRPLSNNMEYASKMVCKEKPKNMNTDCIHPITALSKKDIMKMLKHDERIYLHCISPACRKKIVKIEYLRSFRKIPVTEGLFLIRSER